MNPQRALVDSFARIVDVAFLLRRTGMSWLQFLPAFSTAILA
jgi:hypothetical protein